MGKQNSYLTVIVCIRVGGDIILLLSLYNVYYRFLKHKNTHLVLKTNAYMYIVCTYVCALGSNFLAISYICV